MIIENDVINKKVGKPNVSCLSISKKKNIVEVVNKWQVDGASIPLLQVLY